MLGAAGGSGSVLTMLRADVLHLLPKKLDANDRWTGKYLVNDVDLANYKDSDGDPIYGPHTVTLRETTGNQAVQSAGATLLLVYRTFNEPLRKVMVFDGVYLKPPTAMVSQTLRGFYRSAGGASRLTLVGGTGGNNQTEQVTFDGAVVPALNNAFPQTSPSSDRSWANPTTQVNMPAGAYAQVNFGQEVALTLRNTRPNPKDCQAWAAVFSVRR